jgi:hypothetical protein
VSEEEKTGKKIVLSLMRGYSVEMHGGIVPLGPPKRLRLLSLSPEPTMSLSPAPARPTKRSMSTSAAVGNGDCGRFNSKARITKSRIIYRG